MGLEKSGEFVGFRDRLRRVQPCLRDDLVPETVAVSDRQRCGVHAEFVGPLRIPTELTQPGRRFTPCQTIRYQCAISSGDFAPDQDMQQPTQMTRYQIRVADCGEKLTDGVHSLAPYRDIPRNGGHYRLLRQEKMDRSLFQLHCRLEFIHSTHFID